MAHASTTENVSPNDARSLVEVRALKGLPGDVAAALGRGTIGTAGIADVGERFNTTHVLDPRLPARHFLVAGSSPNYILVAYEQSDGAYAFQATAYRRGNTGWKQVGEWPLSRGPYNLNDLVQLVNSPDTANRVAQQQSLRILERVHRAALNRRDGPLRAENLSDEEVREIQSVLLAIFPGAILNISGVVTGCPCEDGPGCADQVWTVVHLPGLTKGLELSRINAHWSIGAVQQWWLDFDKLEASPKTFTSRNAYWKARQALFDRFPVCPAEPTKPISASTPQVGR
jgi:hypothetical protein